MMKSRIRAGMMAALLLVEMMICSGCGKNASETVPKLLEPASVNSAYRPVELGEIGKTGILYGTVVPTDYCSFYHTSAEITEIVVEVGDYVEEGDVLAYADVESAKGMLEDLTADLTNENQNYDISNRMAQVREHQITADPDATDEVKSNWMSAEKENQRYDRLLHEYRVSKLNESIKKQQDIVEEGTLRAKHSGYVTYTKNLGETTNAGAFENVVVVSDPKETYIEMNNTTIAQYYYTNYEVKYLQLEGKRYDVAEIPYTIDEIILAKTSNRYPNVRMTCPDAGELTLGKTYPIFFRKEKIEEVLVIGVDSLYGEEDNYFVYVKNEEGGQEKRPVTIGESDDNYAEVTSGLTEGELVYYASDARMPADYEEYTVELTDYEVENLSRNYSLADEQISWYDAEYEGTIAEVAVKGKDEVEEGDLLYVIKSDKGKAVLTEAKNKISQENLSYAETIKGIDESLAEEMDEDSRLLISCRREMETVNHEYRLRQLQKAYDQIAKNNDGTGKISVYARRSGTVSSVKVKEGQYVGFSAHVLSVGEKAKTKLLVKMTKLEKEKVYTDNIADFGETVTITAGDTVSYTGHCTGWTVDEANNLEKTWVSTDEEGSYLSYCTTSGNNCAAFYMEVEDEQFYENIPQGKATFSYVSMQDVIAVPSSLVYKETKADKPTQTYYYVWRVVDGELVKQYVLINEALSDEYSMTVILSGISDQDVLAKEK